MKKWIFAITAASVLATLAAIGPRPASALCVEKGQSARDFVLRDIDGDAVSLSDYEGKVVLMVFWASWCSGCSEELQFLKEMSGRFSEDLVVLAINQETEEVSEEQIAYLRQLVAETGIEFPVLVDKGLEVWSEYCVNALPTSILVDRTGKVDIFETHFSWASEETFIAALAEQGVLLD